MSNTREISMADLRDVGHFREMIVGASTSEWGTLTDLSAAEMLDLFDPADPRGSLPTTLVAHSDSMLAGFVSLRSVTMGAIRHPEAYLAAVTPWLSNMWVEPWARGIGLASRLTLALEELAVAAGYRDLYSSTARADSLYHRLGYEELESRVLGGTEIHLIHKRLDSRARSA